MEEYFYSEFEILQDDNTEDIITSINEALKHFDLTIEATQYVNGNIKYKIKYH